MQLGHDEDRAHLLEGEERSRSRSGSPGRRGAATMGVAWGVSSTGAGWRGSAAAWSRDGEREGTKRWGTGVVGILVRARFFAVC